MLSRICYRLKQFYVGMFSRYTRADEAFAQSYLNIQEMALFNQLPGFEKKHAVVVAKKMLEAAASYPELDQRKLVRLGLLYDIGKVCREKLNYYKIDSGNYTFFLSRAL